MIPAHIKESIDRYVVKRTPLGGFLTAVLENKLCESFNRADVNNRVVLYDIALYCYNEIPGNCWGSSEKVKAWLRGDTT